LEHEEVSECAVVELKDDIKGDVPFGFIIKNKS
jgi:acyl-coenzyme A synthetase/AMP-(fatty) acid ligase